jgi:hypothetical protein
MRLAGIALLVAGCAAGPRPRPEAERRINDTAPEKLAAQRSANRDLQLEAEDQRWGFEAARARRREADQKKQAASTAPLPSGPVDLTKQPPGAPTK